MACDIVHQCHKAMVCHWLKLHQQLSKVSLYYVNALVNVCKCCINISAARQLPVHYSCNGSAAVAATSPPQNH